MNNSWFGDSKWLKESLIALDIETDPEGHFKVSGQIIFGLGGLEAIVSPDAIGYRRNGEKVELARYLMANTSGLSIQVI